MTRIIISGCEGKMGRVLASCALEREDCEVAAGIDVNPGEQDAFPVFRSPLEFDGKADVLIDFSNPSLLPALLEFGRKTHTPLVLCTTGYDKAQVDALKKAAEEIPVFYSGNMSIGVNLLIELSKKAAQVLGRSFDVEIVEMHHNQKIDAPSGTALMIADGVSQAEERNMHYVYDRHSQRKKRSPDEIGIHSIRGGSIVGEHEVIFAGPGEVVRISHSAQSKEIFAAGALNAAVFLACKRAGLYNMSDLINQEGSI